MDGWEPLLFNDVGKQCILYCYKEALKYQESHGAQGRWYFMNYLKQIMECAFPGNEETTLRDAARTFELDKKENYQNMKNYWGDISFEIPQSLLKRKLKKAEMK